MRTFLLSLAFLTAVWPAAAQQSGQYNVSKVITALRTRYSDFVALQAHRGLWETAPENSLGAYDAAMDAGVEILEVDIRRCVGTNCLAVQHDNVLDRVTTGTGPVKDTTVAQYQSLWLKDRNGSLSTYKPLLFTDLLTYVKLTMVANPAKGIVLVVDCKGVTGDSAFGPMATLTEALAEAKAFDTANGTNVQSALVFKIWLAHLPQNPSDFETAVCNARGGSCWSTVTQQPGQNLIITVWPSNPSASGCATCAAAFAAYKSKPYLTHYEFITYYPGDPLDQWRIPILTAGGPFGDYYHENVLPEGISRSAGTCCLYTRSNTATWNTAPFPGCFGAQDNCPDMRGSLELTVSRQPTSIVTDKVLDTAAYLQRMGKRNLSRIQ